MTTSLSSLLPLLLSTAVGLSAAPNKLTEAERNAGWKLLFDGKSTDGWHSFNKATFPKTGWTVEDGWLHCSGNGGDIVSEAVFDQFELSWEWKLEKGGNSGLKYFVSDDRDSALGHEYQLLDDDQHADAKLGDGKRVTGSFYDVFKPTVKCPVRPMGEVNESRVIVKGDHVEHWLNGTKVLEYECGSKATQEAVAASKFKNTPAFGTRLKGHILLQAHNSNVWFRNVKVRDLAAK